MHFYYHGLIYFAAENVALPEISNPSMVFSAEMQEVCTFLQSISLDHLSGLFQKEAITMDTLVDFDEMDLVNMGLHQVGYRRKIIKGIKAYKQQITGEILSYQNTQGNYIWCATNGQFFK